MKKVFFLVLMACCLVAVSCNGQKAGDDGDVMILLETTSGDIKLRLYGDTPGHRDNFMNNVKEGLYDGVAFHRVIRNFMIQTGNPDTRPGQIEDTTKKVPTIPAEIVYPKHFHRRGALAAARYGDEENPDKGSDKYQFYIVTGRRYDDQMLSGIESSQYDKKVTSVYESYVDANDSVIRANRKAWGRDGLRDFLDSLSYKAKEYVAANPPAKFTEAQSEAYRIYGGAPYLDGDYTVFGEVVEGMDVVEKIEKVRTDAGDRPLQIIRVKKTTILE